MCRFFFFFRRWSVKTCLFISFFFQSEMVRRVFRLHFADEAKVPNLKPFSLKKRIHTVMLIYILEIRMNFPTKIKWKLECQHKFSLANELIPPTGYKQVSHLCVKNLIPQFFCCDVSCWILKQNLKWKIISSSLPSNFFVLKGKC